MKFPSTIYSSFPPHCHMSLICCRSNYLYCFVGSFISFLNSQHLPPLSLSISLCASVLWFWVLLTLQVCVVYLICCRRRGNQINGCCFIQTTAQQHSNEKTHRDSEEREQNGDRHRKKVGECVQVLLKVCKLYVPVPKTRKICCQPYRILL